MLDEHFLFFKGLPHRPLVPGREQIGNLGVCLDLETSARRDTPKSLAGSRVDAVLVCPSQFDPVGFERPGSQVYRTRFRSEPPRTRSRLLWLELCFMQM